MEPVFTVRFDLSGDCGTSLITCNGAVEIISLDGVASGALFDGVAEPYGTNVQLIDEGGQRHIFSRYILKGHDKNGVPTRIFVENEGWFSGATGRAFQTTPHFMSDNHAIDTVLKRSVYRGRGERKGCFIEESFFKTTGPVDCGLTNQDIADLSRFEYVHFKKGDYLIRQGEEVRSAYFLMSGNVKVSQITPKGDLLVYDVRHADQGLRRFLGVLSSYRPENVHRNSFVAATEVYCYRLSREDTHAFMLDHPMVLAGFMSLVMERYAQIEEEFLFKQTKNTPGQVCSTILRYMEYRDCQYWMSCEMTNTKISRVTGANRVTVVKIVQELIRQGLLEKNEFGTRIVDPEELKSIARGEKTVKYGKGAR